MMIRVQYISGTYDYIPPVTLDDKLLQGEIAKFLRSSGWAVVGRDSIRRPKSDKRFYFGPERRLN